MRFTCFWMFKIQNYRIRTLHWSDQILYSALEFATAAEKIVYTALNQSTAWYKIFSNAVTRFHYISRMQRTNHLHCDSHPDQEGTKGPLTGKNKNRWLQTKDFF